jgi:galactitol-specific phosphotransferase system IIC component
MALATPPTFLMANWFAPLITKMAVDTAAFSLPKGATEITWLAHNAQYMRWSMIETAEMFVGKIWPGIVIVPVLIVAYWFYVREMKRREAAALEKMSPARPELSTASVRSSQAPTAAAENSAPAAIRT